MLSQFDDEETAAYFERLNAPLRRMPQADRAELHAELRQHLDALAAAHEELGALPEEANHAALRQFGDPVKIGRKLFSEWARASRTSLWRIIGWTYLWCFASGWFFKFFFDFLRKTDSLSMATSTFWTVNLHFIVTALIGFCVGRRFGRRSMLGVTLASAISYVYVLLYVYLVYFVFSSRLSSFPILAITIPESINLLLLLTGAWLAQKFDGSPRLSLAGIKSRFRR